MCSKLNWSINSPMDVVLNMYVDTLSRSGPSTMRLMYSGVACDGRRIIYFQRRIIEGLKNMRQQNRSLVVLLVCFLEIKETVYLYAVDIYCNPVSNLQQL